MKIAYFDCFAGASGDMILGSLVNAGVRLSELQRRLNALPLEGYRLEAREERRGVMAGTRVLVDVDQDIPQPKRTLGDILALLDTPTLSAKVREQSVAVFHRLAEAEAKVHGVSAEEVHFHEVGAIDSMVDVVGSLIGLELLEIDKAYCAPLPMAAGIVRTAHGVLPLPAPATLEIAAAAQAPVQRVAVDTEDLGELVTPTAAALLTTVAEFRQPHMAVHRVGYGVGTRDHPSLPNVLRVWIGEAADESVTADTAVATGRVQLLETNIDDMNPELYGYVAERLFAEGALDVWYTSVQMKKGRPGTQISVLCRPEVAAHLAALLLRETSTLGVRTKILERWEAERTIVQFDSTLGPAAAKIKRWHGEVLQVAPEYEACKALAERTGLPLAEVYRRLELEARAHLAG